MPNKSKKKRDEEFGQLIGKLSEWQIPTEALANVHDSARASLNEVKALTEYEDGKISRLLTVVAFLSAVVGAAFTRFASVYRWPSVKAYSHDMSWWLPFCTYAAFFIYVILVTGAVVVLLRAIRPTFNRPASWKNPDKTGLPGSMLFYSKILDVPAGGWGDAFVLLSGQDGAALKAYYAKCYIGEAYLVAEKVADKLRVAAWGVGALIWAMGVLLLFFVLFAATAQIVPASNLP